MRVISCMTPIILVVGAHGAGKRTLATGLASYSTLIASSTSDNSNVKLDLNLVSSSGTVRVLSEGVLATVYDVTFDNKYYSAQVQVWAVQSTTQTQTITIPKDVICQAVVGVFDGSSSTANVDSMSIGTRVESLVNQFEPEVVALVATRQCDDTTVCLAPGASCSSLQEWLRKAVTSPIAAGSVRAWSVGPAGGAVVLSARSAASSRLAGRQRRSFEARSSAASGSLPPTSAATAAASSASEPRPPRRPKRRWRRPQACPQRRW